jgi:hypothetical protein
MMGLLLVGILVPEAGQGIHVDGTGKEEEATIGVEPLLLHHHHLGRGGTSGSFGNGGQGGCLGFVGNCDQGERS